jgi:hypothetical protein
VRRRHTSPFRLGYELDDRGSICINGRDIFSPASGQALGPTQPPVHWVPADFFLGVNQPRREADQTPPSSDEVRNSWSYTSTPPARLRGVVLG